MYVIEHRGFITMLLRSNFYVQFRFYYRLVKKFPEVSADELLSLLDLRGDISRVDARQLIIDLKPGAATDRNIFSNLLPL